MKTDIVVLGAGIVGLSSAIHLARRGKSVVLLDRRGAGEVPRETFGATIARLCLFNNRAIRARAQET